MWSERLADLYCVRYISLSLVVYVALPEHVCNRSA